MDGKVVCGLIGYCEYAREENLLPRFGIWVQGKAEGRAAIVEKLRERDKDVVDHRRPSLRRLNCSGNMRCYFTDLFAVTRCLPFQFRVIRQSFTSLASCIILGSLYSAWWDLFFK